jgi:transcriptional regulator with XRE-family HTH domain
VDSPRDVLANVGARVREIRLSRGWTQDVCAEHLKMDVRLLRRVDGGKLNVTVFTLVRIAQRLGVPIASLFEASTLAEPRRPGRPRRREVPVTHEADAVPSPPPAPPAPARGVYARKVTADSSALQEMPGPRPSRGSHAVKVRKPRREQPK